MKLYKLYYVFLTAAMLSCTADPAVDSESSAKEESAVITTLPMSTFELSNLNEFKTEGANWKIAGAVHSEFDKEQDLQFSHGNGILINDVARDDHSGANIFSVLEHGDLEISFEVLVPKGSNSGLYFQSRYELQIRDSADDPELSPDDMGGIYDGVKSNEKGEDVNIPGETPLINAARAAGLWQEFRVFFRAPRFDDSGAKIENAKFDYIYLNGYMIHEKLELEAPTRGAVDRGEVAMGPFMIQGDHGPVAFRNIQFKSYELEKPSLTNLSYKMYDGKFDYIPDFSKMEVVKTGSAENFDKLTDLAGENEGFSLQFEGDLNVPRDGEYLFETFIDDGGDLYIDDQLVVHNEGEPGWGAERGLVNLTKGSHKLRQSFYQEVWSANLTMNIEGPGVEKIELPVRETPREVPSWAIRKPLVIDVGTEPELIRAFVNHGDLKKTHILSVGTPAGVHYSYDTRNNQLINVWRGEFADVSRMWVNRGEEQRLEPVAAVLMLGEVGRKSDCLPKGYALNDSGMPIFEFHCDDQKIMDEIAIQSEKSLSRLITVDKGEFPVTIATDDNIVKLTNGYYSIGNRYYLKPVGTNTSWAVDGEKLNAIAKSDAPVKYEINW